MTVKLLPVQRIGAVKEDRKSGSWLIKDLWAAEGVGILGGPPKACKSWLALDFALSVATGTSVLGTYTVPNAGPVLLFAAEDAPAMVRARLKGMAEHREIDFEKVPIHLVLAISLKLDSANDQDRLVATVKALRPRLLILDPFVRLHRIDENSALEVSGILAYLREIQRLLHVAILVVHHARKSSASGTQAGLSLRGSGDFWAWGDSNLYLRRKKEDLQLTIEHRYAAAPDPLSLKLHCEEGVEPYLKLQIPSIETSCPDNQNQLLEIKILKYLQSAGDPCRQESIRKALKVRMQTLVDALRELEKSGRINRIAGGWESIQPVSNGPIQTQLFAR